jgi:hypothetical protein
MSNGSILVIMNHKKKRIIIMDSYNYIYIIPLLWINNIKQESSLY